MLRITSMTQSHVAASYVAGMWSACALNPLAHIQAPSRWFIVICHLVLDSCKSDQKEPAEKGKHCRLTQKLCTDHTDSTARSFDSYVPLNRSGCTDHRTRTVAYLGFGKGGTTASAQSASL